MSKPSNNGKLKHTDVAPNGIRLETIRHFMMMMSANLPPRFTASASFSSAKRYGNVQPWELEADELQALTPNGKKRFLLNPNTLKRTKWDNLFSGKLITLSIMLHGTVATIALVLFLLAQLLGWDLSFLDVKVKAPNDVEFVIVNNPKPEKPVDLNTKNRSTAASRSGGEKSPQRQGEEQQVSGAVGATPAPESPPESSSTPIRQQSTQTPAVQAPTEKPIPPVEPKKKTKIAPPTPPIAVYSPTAPAAKWKPAKTTQPTTTTNLDDDFEPPSPILTKPSKTGSTSGNTSTSSAAQKAIRLGPDQIGSPSAKPTPSGNRGQGGNSSYSNPANSGGGKGLAGVDALADFDFAPYISGVTQRIKRNFNPPSKDDSLKAVVIFTISRSGGVSGVRLLRSSGLPLFDEAALSAIKSSAPFRTFPPDADKPSIQMEFSFDYLGVRG